MTFLSMQKNIFDLLPTKYNYFGMMLLFFERIIYYLHPPVELQIFSEKVLLQPRLSNTSHTTEA